MAIAVGANYIADYNCHYRLIETPRDPWPRGHALVAAGHMTHACKAGRPNEVTHGWSLSCTASDRADVSISAGNRVLIGTDFWE